MILATSSDYEYPHIDWVSDYSDSVYSSAGVPDTDHDPAVDHAVTWSPCADQLEKYIGFLETLEPGDGIVVCGKGPAPLMGPVKSADNGELTTVSIDSPSRVIRWQNTDRYAIEFAKADPEIHHWNKVYHVEGVEIEGDFK